jgi:hypothetical protein
VTGLDGSEGLIVSRIDGGGLLPGGLAATPVRSICNTSGGSDSVPKYAAKDRVIR